MKRQLISISLAALVSLAAGLPTSGLADSKTVSLSVPTMYCAMCPITVRMALEQVAGVTDAAADYETLSATVTYDTGKTNLQALVDATTNAGYPSTIIQ